MKEVSLNLVGVDALGAYNRLQDELGRVRDGLKPEAPAQRMRFTEYAASLFEHKLKTGRIKSAKSREKWEYVIRLHLAPVFGELYIDAIRRADIKAWKERMGVMISGGRASSRSPVSGRRWGWVVWKWYGFGPKTKTASWATVVPSGRSA